MHGTGLVLPPTCAVNRPACVPRRTAPRMPTPPVPERREPPARAVDRVSLGPPLRGARPEAERIAPRRARRLVLVHGGRVRALARPDQADDRGGDDGHVRDGERHAVFDAPGEKDVDPAGRHDECGVYEGDDRRHDFKEVRD